MKKVILVLLVVIMAISVSACADNGKNDSQVSVNDTQQTQDASPAGNNTPAEDDTYVDEEEQSADVDVSEEGQDYYAVATSYSKKEVEDFAVTVRTDIMNNDWEALSKKMFFPVNVNGEEIKSAEDFLCFMDSKSVSDDFYAAIKGESCVDMFANSNGIMLGDGEVWIAECLVNTSDEKGQLYIIALNNM